MVRETIVKDAFSWDIRGDNRDAIGVGRTVCRCEREAHAISNGGLTHDGFARNDRRVPTDHGVVVGHDLHEQFVTAGRGAAADHDGMRAAPALDLRIDSHAKLRAGGREKYGSWMKPPIGHGGCESNFVAVCAANDRIDVFRNETKGFP